MSTNPSAPQSLASSSYTVTDSDMRDPSLYRLNSVIGSINVRLDKNESAVAAVTKQISAISGSSAPVVIGSLSGTHSSRIAQNPAANFVTGSFFFETDRTSLYMCQVVGLGNQWVWVGGEMQAPWSSMPSDLTATDKGFLFFDNANSLHIWRWIGSGWAWGPGNRASGEMAEFDADPGAGWHLCDGTAGLQKYASNGSRSSFAVPDRRNFYTEGGAVYTGTGVAAAIPPATNSGGGQAINSTPATVQSGAGATVVGTVSAGAFTEPTISFNSPPVPTFTTLYYYRL